MNREIWVSSKFQRFVNDVVNVLILKSNYFSTKKNCCVIFLSTRGWSWIFVTSWIRPQPPWKIFSTCCKIWNAEILTDLIMATKRIWKFMVVRFREGWQNKGQIQNRTTYRRPWHRYYRYNPLVIIFSSRFGRQSYLNGQTFRYIFFTVQMIFMSHQKTSSDLLWNWDQGSKSRSEVILIFYYKRIGFDWI